MKAYHFNILYKARRKVAQARGWKEEHGMVFLKLTWNLSKAPSASTRPT